MSTLKRFDSCSSGLSEALCQYIQFKVSRSPVKYHTHHPDSQMIESADESLGEKHITYNKDFQEVVEANEQLCKLTKWKIGQSVLELHIRKSLTDMIYGSNMIEGIDIDYLVTEELCDGIFTGHGMFFWAEIDEEPETRNQKLRITQHAKAAIYIMNQLCMSDQDLTEDVILETHRKLTHGIDFGEGRSQDCSGKYRTDVIEGPRATAHPDVIPLLMKRMVGEPKSDVKRMNKDGDPIALASKYAHIFASIHPFAEGSGEVSRLILNALLFKYGNYLVCLGQTEEDRSMYNGAVSKSSALGEMNWDAGENKARPYQWLALLVLRNVKASMNELTKSMGYGVIEIS